MRLAGAQPAPPPARPPLQVIATTREGHDISRLLKTGTSASHQVTQRPNVSAILPPWVVEAFLCGPPIVIVVIAFLPSILLTLRKSPSLSASTSSPTSALRAERRPPAGWSRPVPWEATHACWGRNGVGGSNRVPWAPNHRICPIRVLWWALCGACCRHQSPLSAKGAGSQLGDKSVQKARGGGPSPSPCVPVCVASATRATGCLCVYPLVVGTLLAAVVGITVPVRLLATKETFKLHLKTLCGPK